MPRSDEAAAFFHAVYCAVQEIPHGKVTSYGHIAKLVGTREFHPAPDSSAHDAFHPVEQSISSDFLKLTVRHSPAPPPGWRLSQASPPRRRREVQPYQCPLAEGNQLQGDDITQVSACLGNHPIS